VKTTNRTAATAAAGRRAPLLREWWAATGRGGSTGMAWLWVAVLALLLLLVWAAVVVAGGSRTALPHLFYLPIILATVPFGMRGALAVAVVAGLLAGPLTPMDTATNEQQSVTGWLIRCGAFLVVGAVASLPLALRERSYSEQLNSELRRAFHRTPVGRTADDELVARVRGVLARRAFHCVYQPIYAFDGGRLVAVEALTRFTGDPRRTPDQWFAAAHQAGVGPELEIAAIGAALDGAAGLPPEVVMSVNASPGTLADPRMLELLERIGTRRLLVEITEHAAIEDYRLIAEQIGPLRSGGVRIAVDDAGAGFASLRHIVQLAPDVIKLDMSLTQHVESSPVRRALAGSLIEFVQYTGAMLVVEGIENHADLAAWSALGADAVQGYLVGRPGPLPAPNRCSLVTSLPLSHAHHRRPGRLSAGRALA
jgi:EAL domain-containing protein (putative c-di-GMP-specific phosphodiesterase class I)